MTWDTVFILICLWQKALTKAQLFYILKHAIELHFYNEYCYMNGVWICFALPNELTGFKRGKAETYSGIGKMSAHMGTLNHTTSGAEEVKAIWCILKEPSSKKYSVYLIYHDDFLKKRSLWKLLIIWRHYWSL